MKMLMIIYNEALDMELMEVLENCKIKGYTKVKDTFGKGGTSGTHLGTDIWPGRNNVLYVACSEAEAVNIMSQVKELRTKLSTEGIKAFTWDLKEVV